MTWTISLFMLANLQLGANRPELIADDSISSYWENQKAAALQRAEDFLNSLAKEEEICELISKKLYVKTLCPGDGTDSIMSSKQMTLMKYVVKIVEDGREIDVWSSEKPVKISLKDVIPGFRDGVMGMTLGEKRKLYIHPDLGHGISGKIEPNQLLVIEVHLVQVEHQRT